MDSVQSNFQDFNKMVYLLNLIENPFKNHFDEVDYSFINFIDLNIGNSRKYYPQIREFLKNNELCHEDLYYDFVEIQTMSNYLYDKIDEIMNYKDIKSYYNIFVDSLDFISKMIKEFHCIFDFKLDYINSKISKEDYDTSYREYKKNYRKNHNEFYTKYYKEKSENATDIKEIWALEII